MKFKDTGPSGLSLHGLLVLVCIFPLTTLAANTVDEFKQSLKSNPNLECYVCNSRDGPCTEERTYNHTKVNCATEYLTTVYGDNVFDKTGSLHEWPGTLTELNAAGKDKPGWTDAGFPGQYSPVTRPGGNTPSSYTYSSLPRITNDDDNKDKSPPSPNKDKGYQTCRTMKVWISEDKPYRTNGKINVIPESMPRTIRTCSLHPPVKKGENCNIIQKKPGTMIEICYCDKNENGKSGPCNGSSYLRISQYWILAASLLVFIANLGMNMH